MKSIKNTQRRRSGFTLIEMIGVLAIIAVLAALLIPRIFSAINESRVNGAALSYNSLKSAATTYFGKYGRFGGNGGTNFTGTELTNGVSNWDSAYLLTGGFIERPFETKLGTGSNIQVRGASSSVTAVDATNTAYDLDGSGTTVNDVTGAVVLQAILSNVAEDDAIELNNKIDGTTLGAASGAADLKGRVKYAVAASGSRTVYLYIAHK
jgi:prepilin-type N-terminal cleavage/methylation domain-containing protein